MNELMSLYKAPQKASLSLLLSKDTVRRQLSMNQKRPLNRYRIYQCLDLGLTNLHPCEKQMFVYLNHLVYGILNSTQMD